MKLPIKKLHPAATVPQYKRAGDIALDIYSCETKTVAAGQRTIISTGIAVAIPIGYGGLIWDRSGLAANYGLTILAGVIDSNYRGEIMIVLFNTTDQDYKVQKDDRVAQMIIQPIVNPDIVPVDDLDSTERGEARFASTGR
ncbi:MAG: dUTP diphosphatase [Candidatus Komeilibacteria bacterium]|nr:dUTP diphosphatase [Candidatus Komeilibacteria bacterium]